MATKTYRAIAKGYVDGRVIQADEVFTTEFKEIDREETEVDEKTGKRPVGAIKRDKDGTPILKPAKNPPSWAVLLGKNEVAEIVTDPNTSQDPNFDEMEDAALQAYAAERHIQFTKKTSREDLITAIKAAPDATR